MYVGLNAVLQRRNVAELCRALPPEIARAIFEIISALPFDAANNILDLPDNYKTSANLEFCATMSEVALRTKLQQLVPAVYAELATQLHFGDPGFGDVPVVATESPEAAAQRIALNKARAEARRQVLRSLYLVFTVGTTCPVVGCNGGTHVYFRGLSLGRRHVAATRGSQQGRVLHSHARV
jgi:hypothetical protein